MKLKFISIFIVTMFLTAGLFAQKQVNTADTQVEKFKKEYVAEVEDIGINHQDGKNDIKGCEHSLILVDSYGDGWNGNTISLWVNTGLVLDQVTAAGYGATHTFSCEEGDQIDVVYNNTGGWAYENSWTLVDGMGVTLIVGDGSTPTYTQTTTGGTCPVVLADDLSVLDITPNWVFAGDTYTPSVTITNPGTNDQDAYSVTLYDNTGTYSQTINVTETIASGGTYTVTGFQWDEVPAGTYTMTAVVTLAGDENSANNVMAIDFTSVEFANYNETTIYAFDASDWTGSGLSSHIVGVNPVDAIMSDIGPSGVGGIDCGDFVDGILIGIASNIVYGISNTGVAYELATISDLSGASGLAWDVAGDEVYISTTTALYTIDDNDAAIAVGTYTSTTNMIGIAADLEGNLYGVDLADNLYSIDKTTGAETLIGALGIDLNYAQDIGYDRTNGILYGNFYLGGGTGGLYTVDVTTGVATQIGTNFGDELTMCAIYYEVPIPTVTFTVDDGTDPIDGALIEINYETYTATAGTVIIELDEGSVYTYTVTADGFEDYFGTYTVTADPDQLEEVHMTELVYTVTFTVDDGTDPLEFVEIVINGETLTTDVDGIATIELTNGDYDYSATYEQCDEYIETVTVVGATDEFISMTCAFTYSVTISVIDSETTDPIVGAIVTVNDGMVKTDWIENTDGSGIATFDLLSGDYSYTVDADGYISSDPVEFTVDNENLNLDAISLIAVGITDLNSNISIYPNPSNGMFTIAVDGIYTLEVMDITGKVVLIQELTNTENTINIDQAGVYTIRLTNEGTTTNYKVIVE